MKLISKNIRYLRRTAGLSQHQLADETDLKRSNIAAYESKDVEPRLPVVLQLAKFFDVKPEDLILHDLEEYDKLNRLQQLKRTSEGVSVQLRNPDVSLSKTTDYFSGHFLAQTLAVPDEAHGGDATGDGAIKEKTIKLARLIESRTGIIDDFMARSKKGKAVLKKLKQYYARNENDYGQMSRDVAKLFAIFENMLDAVDDLISSNERLIQGIEEQKAHNDASKGADRSK